MKPMTFIVDSITKNRVSKSLLLFLRNKNMSQIECQKSQQLCKMWILLTLIHTQNSKSNLTTKTTIMIKTKLIIYLITS